MFKSSTFNVFRHELKPACERLEQLERLERLEHLIGHSFYGYALGEIARLIDIRTAMNRNMVGKELQGNAEHDRG